MDVSVQLSVQLDPMQNSTVSGVEELGRNGDRIHYRLLSGSGPETGWATLRQEQRAGDGASESRDLLAVKVSISLKDKELLRKAGGLEKTVRGAFAGNPCCGTCCTEKIQAFFGASGLRTSALMCKPASIPHECTLL